MKSSDPLSKSMCANEDRALSLAREKQREAGQCLFPYCKEDANTLQRYC